MINNLYIWKRYFWILPCLAAFIFSGCEKGLSNELNVEKNLENDVVITENDKKYEAHITYVPQGLTTLSFKSPENLANMTFEYKDGKYVVSNKELSGEYNINPLEKNSIFSRIMGVINALGSINELKIDSKDGENLVFKVDFENLKYKVLTDKEGKILSIENPESNFQVEFVR